MDVVVTVPKWFGLDRWIAEGDAAGEPCSGQLWAFYCGGAKPSIERGERVYVVYNGKLRGYALLVDLKWDGMHGELIRGGNAVAVTIDEETKGFRGWRYRWWSQDREKPFPDWRKP